MRKFALLFILLLVVTPVIGQLHFPLGDNVIIIFPKLDKLNLSWEHNWKNVKGNPENVVYFEVCQVYEGIDTLRFELGKTATDSITFRPPTRFASTFFPFDGFYYFEIVAVDWAGNNSVVHCSTDSTAWLRGWKVFQDDTEPSRGKMLRIE